MISHVQYTEQGYINATVDGVEMTIPDVPSNRHRRMIAEWEAKGNTIAPYVAPVEKPQPKRYSKKLLFEAMTEAEYAKFESYETQHSKREARMFREATELNEADEGFAKVLGLMQAAYGEDRAAELLAAAEF